MVRNFEEQTHELTDYELKTILPLISKGLDYRKGDHMAITSFQAMRILKSKWPEIKISGPRWRKIINHIRVNSLIPGLVSTSKGYYIATSKSELKNYMESLRERINSITMVYDSMEYQLKTFY